MMVSLLPATLVLTALIAAYSVSAGNNLEQDQVIIAGGNITVAGYCSLVFTRAGNLELLFHRGEFQRTLWSAGISSSKPKHAIMQGDGNLVAVDQDGKGYWNSPSKKTSDGEGPFRVDLQEDCNLVIYTTAARALWATDTNYVKQTIFEGVRFRPDSHQSKTIGYGYEGDMLVSTAAPTCWLDFTFPYSQATTTFGGPLLTLYQGKKRLWVFGATKLHGVAYLHLSAQGQLIGDDGEGEVVGRAIGNPDQGVGPYELKLYAPCRLEIRDVDGHVVFSAP